MREKIDAYMGLEILSFSGAIVCFYWTVYMLLFFHQTKLYQLRARKFPNNAKTRKLLLQISKFVERGISVPCKQTILIQNCWLWRKKLDVISTIAGLLIWPSVYLCLGNCFIKYNLAVLSSSYKSCCNHWL